MSGKFEQEHKGRRKWMIPAAIILIILAAAIWLLLQKDSQTVPPQSVQTSATEPPTEQSLPIEPEVREPENTESTPSEPVHGISTVTIGAMGDLLMHNPIIDQSLKSDGSYDFSHIFQYIREEISGLDYAAANLETTLFPERKKLGRLLFSCPESIADDIKDAGFDLLLTANNHSYDNSIEGYLRTIEVTHDRGFDTLGTYADGSDQKYIIKEIGGIRFGMIAYTYETNDGTGSHPALNGNQAYDVSYDMINCFSPKNLPTFYEELGRYLEEMKAQGAEATILFIHWGVEWMTYASDEQRHMAQEISDLGVDVIVGGHPHVLEPVTMLESRKNPDHKTLCVYSLGNAVSNTRRGDVTADPGGHTEDGAVFTMTFEKYSDGTVYLMDADVIPTWVNRRSDGIHTTWPIVPLRDELREQWAEKYDMAENDLIQARKSYDRTMEILGGIADVKSCLAGEKQDRDSAYIAAAGQ